jgi:hypothetical protein
LRKLAVFCLIGWVACASQTMLASAASSTAHSTVVPSAGSAHYSTGAHALSAGPFASASPVVMRELLPGITTISVDTNDTASDHSSTGKSTKTVLTYPTRVVKAARELARKPSESNLRHLLAELQRAGYVERMFPTGLYCPAAGTVVSSQATERQVVLNCLNIGPFEKVSRPPG